MYYLLRIIVMFFILLYSSPILSQTNECTVSHTRGGYYLQNTDYHSITMGFAKNFNSKRYLLETNWIPITWISNDYFNNQKVNFAFPLIPVVFLTSFPSTFYSKDKLEMWEISSIIFNSKHHFFILGNFDCSHNMWPRGISFFFKNNIDWFCFRANQWIDFSPGIGIGLYYSRAKHSGPNISAYFGIARNIATRFTEVKYNNIFFFEINIMGRGG